MRYVARYLVNDRVDSQYIRQCAFRSFTSLDRISFLEWSRRKLKNAVLSLKILRKCTLQNIYMLRSPKILFCKFLHFVLLLFIFWQKVYLWYADWPRNRLLPFRPRIYATCKSSVMWYFIINTIGNGSLFYVNFLKIILKSWIIKGLRVA